MALLSDIEKPQSGGGGNIWVPIIALGGLGVAGYFGYQAWDKYRADKAIKQSNENALKSTLDLKKRQENINKIETTKGFFSGVTANSPKKSVTVNIFDQTKKLISEFYTKLTDKNGLDLYIKKPVDSINQANVRSIYFNTPLNSIARLNKIYNIYTSKSFKEDSLKLKPNLIAEIEAINKVSQQKFPSSYK